MPKLPKLPTNAWVIIGSGGLTVVAFVALMLFAPNPKKLTPLPPPVASPEPELIEYLDTAQGPILVTKDKNDPCLRLTATIEQVEKLGGVDKLKETIKQRYGASCLLFQ